MRATTSASAVASGVSGSSYCIPEEAQLGAGAAAGAAECQAVVSPVSLADALPTGPASLSSCIALNTGAIRIK